MNIPVFLFYFSPCKTTEKVARAIADGTGEPYTAFDLTDQNFAAPTLPEGALAIFAAPIFGGLVPEVALNRMQEINGEGCLAAAVVNFGNRNYDDGLLQLGDVLESAGFTLLGGAAFVGQHSCQAKVATGRPKPEDITEAQTFGAALYQKCETPSVVTLPGKRPYKSLGGSMGVPTVSSACIRCGLCASRCPAGAISAEDPTKTDPEKCIACRRCVVICPSAARSFTSFPAKMIEKILPLMAKGKKPNETFL